MLDDASFAVADACWVLTAGAAGLRSQGLGLAEAVGLPILEKQVVTPAPWSLLPGWLNPVPLSIGAQGPLTPPWPALVIACGQRSAAPALAVKRLSGAATLVVYIQNPGFGWQEFDLIVAMPHDRLSGRNVLTVRTALHRVSGERLASEGTIWRGRLGRPGKPLLGVLVGGDSGSYRLTPAVIDRLLRLLRTAHAQHGVDVVVTPSRRTGAQATGMLAEALAAEPWATLWDGAGDNPYFGILARADRLVVTGESISMISEALATGRPVHVLPLAGYGRRHEAFLTGLVGEGMVSRVRDAGLDWSFAGHPPVDATAEAAGRLRAMLASRASTLPVD